VRFTGGMNYRGRRVTIMGLGHFGGAVATARWLARQGAIVTISDLADENALANSLALLADVPIAAVHVGGHREEDFQHADLVVVNPAVRPTSPWLQLARQSGARLCTELELFMENCPSRIIGATGSNGKSTTAAMIAAILDAAGRQTFLGGNIGGSLLEQLPQIGRDDWVVLEISSFQLWHFAPAARMPHVVIVTGCTPNHLDWHASLAEYVAAKQRILTGQTPADLAVLNTFDAEVTSWRHLVRGREIPLPKLDILPPLPVPGEHNRINAACAAAAAAAVGCGPEEIRHGLEQFGPLPQRLEWFAAVKDRPFYNDSTATTPESTIAALRSLDVPVWLMAGGKSKGFDFGPLAAEIVHRARGAALFGAAAAEIGALVAAQRPAFPYVVVETMEDALRWCWPHSRPGEAIVLSPACASTDQFRNFQHRGQHFVELVRHLLTRNPVML
jgi:UDP-N-acetylmuramoylalanine--D-glutamate ligase